MIFAIATFIKWFFPDVDISRVQRYVFWAVVLLGLLAVLILVIGIKSCMSKPPKFDEQTIQKVNSQDKKEVVAEITKVVEDNADVVETVDQRTTIAETNVVERNRLADEKVADAVKKVEEAKRLKGNVTQEDLECILVPSHCS